MKNFILKIHFCLRFKWKEKYNNIIINIIE